MTLLKQSQFGEVASFAISEEIDGLKIVHETCQASISLFGGQVLSWQPNGEKEVFWLSYQSDYSTQTAIRGGIPLCWPWFGNRDNEKSHGFARLSQWQLDSITITESEVTVILSLSGQDEADSWPFPYKLVQQLTFGKTFKQKLQITNLSDQSIFYTGALHSYFNISHPENVEVNTLKELPFVDKIPEQQGPELLPNCVGPIDRIYQGTNQQKIVDTKWQRVIQLDAENTTDWVLWNPGKQTAQAMKDVPDGGEDNFVCLEAASTQQQELPANQTVTFSQTIKLKVLSDIDM